MSNDYSFVNRLTDALAGFKKSDTWVRLKGGDPDAPYDRFKDVGKDGRGKYAYMHLQSGRFCYKDDCCYETYYDRNTGELIYSKGKQILDAANRRNLDYSIARGWKAYWKYLRSPDGKLDFPSFFDIERDDFVEIKDSFKPPYRFEKRYLWSGRSIDLSFQEYLQYDLPYHFSDRSAKKIDQDLYRHYLKRELFQRLLRRSAIQVDPKFYDNIIITDISACDKVLNEPYDAYVYRERFKEELRRTYKDFKDALIDLRDYIELVNLAGEDEKYVKMDLEAYYYEAHPYRLNMSEAKAPEPPLRRCRVI